jgi:hypothetical protein
LLAASLLIDVVLKVLSPARRIRFCGGSSEAVRLISKVRRDRLQMMGAGIDCLEISFPAFEHFGGLRWY